MRKRWLVGTLVVLVLALLGRAATLAQKVNPKPVLPVAIPANSQDPQPKRWRSAGDPQPKMADDPAILPPPGRTTEPEDPIGAVDSFLQKNQKEAEESIRALTQEAETLRARLQKVETALSRWQGVARALDQQAKADGSKPVHPTPSQDAGLTLPPPGVSADLPTQLEPVPPPTTGSKVEVPADLPTIPGPVPGPPPTSAPTLPAEPATLPPPR